MNKLVVSMAVAGGLAWSGAARADDAGTPSQYTKSLSVDFLEPAVGGPLDDLWGTFVEEQFVLSDKFSLPIEEGYLESGDDHSIGGSSSGLHTRMAIVTIGLVYWPKHTFDGPFISIRPEARLVSAENDKHVVAAGNLHPGWEWTLDHFTVIAAASFALASDGVRDLAAPWRTHEHAKETGS